VSETVALYIVSHKIFAHVLSKHINQVPKDGLVLDIGCGLGDITKFVSDSLKRITIGLDVHLQICHEALRNSEGPMNLGIILYSGGYIPLRDEAVHLAYSHEVIEHVEHDMLFLSEISRVLKSGGLLILSTPNAYMEPYDDAKVSVGHLQHYTQAELIGKLTKATFDIENIFWRSHFMYVKINSIMLKLGRRFLRTRQIQPFMTCWSGEKQSKLTGTALKMYKHIVDPIITALLLAEFSLKKTRVEAPNMIVVARKRV